MITKSDLYVPTGPYIFQSGKRRGECLELLMFSDYGLVIWFYNLLNRKGHYNQNSLHEHLNWLIPRGKDRRATMICPQCGNNEVKFYSIIGENAHTTRLDFTSCEKISCQDGLRQHRLTRILPINFPSLLAFPEKSDRKFVAEMFKQIFGLPKILRRDAAYEFFCK